MAKRTVTPWIATYSGKRFDLLNPTPDMVDIKDIATALSQLCRFNGHTIKFYSVAAHSIACARHAAKITGELININVKAALLHDAAEAYIGDVAKPLKILLPDYREIEKRIERVIFAKYGILDADWEFIKTIDAVMLRAEAERLLRNHAWAEDLPRDSTAQLARNYPTPTIALISAEFLDFAEECGIDTGRPR